MFFLFVVVILWVFQVVFMGSFYRIASEMQIQKSSSEMISVLSGKGNVGAKAYDIADRTGVCITVYEIKDGKGAKLTEAHVKNGCYIHSLITNDTLNQIYNKSKNIDGILAAELSEPDQSKGRPYVVYSECAKVGNSDYLILFNTETLPVETMALTVTLQLSIVTVILIIGAAVLALIMSRKITRPVSRLCGEAEKLAAGDYNVDPSHSGVLEINRLGDAIGYAAYELERSDRMQKELIANVTHDLRTPLTMISGYGEVMRDIPGEVTPENIQVIIDESARLSALVNDVLEMSKVKSGSMTLHHTSFDIVGCVKSSVHRYSEMLKGKGYTVEYESNMDECTVTADETKLMQAFCNLLNNAVNFTGDSKRVIVRQYMRDGMCRTEVTDFGMGIPANELPNIWDRYYRARDFQNKGIPGSGLGLAIVKHILIMHDVSFGVESTVGKGSTFWFEMKPEK